jgi:hypothetical protein
VQCHLNDTSDSGRVDANSMNTTSASELGEVRMRKSTVRQTQRCAGLKDEE